MPRGTRCTVVTRNCVRAKRGCRDFVSPRSFARPPFRPFRVRERRSFTVVNRRLYRARHASSTDVLPRPFEPGEQTVHLCLCPVVASRAREGTDADYYP